MPRICHRAGKLAIIDQVAYPQAVDSPAANRAHVYWHSDLAYQQIVYDVTQTITLPQRTSSQPLSFISNYTFPAHNLGVVPFGLLRVGSSQYPACGLLTYSGGDKFRTLSLILTTTSVTVREVTIIDGVLAAATHNVRVILYREPPAIQVAKAAHFNPSTGALTLGKGKFSTANRYLREDRGPTPDFWLVMGGRTIDSEGRNFKQVLPDGASVGFGSLPFTGSGFRGVSD